MQNCDLIGLLESLLKQNEFLQDFNHELITYLWNGPLCWHIEPVISVAAVGNDYFFHIYLPFLCRWVEADCQLGLAWGIFISQCNMFGFQYCWWSFCGSNDILFFNNGILIPHSFWETVLSHLDHYWHRKIHYNCFYKMQWTIPLWMSHSGVYGEPRTSHCLNPVYWHSYASLDPNVLISQHQSIVFVGSI